MKIEFSPSPSEIVVVSNHKIIFNANEKKLRIYQTKKGPYGIPVRDDEHYVEFEAYFKTEDNIPYIMSRLFEISEENEKGIKEFIKKSDSND